MNSEFEYELMSIVEALSDAEDRTYSLLSKEADSFNSPLDKLHDAIRNVIKVAVATQKQML